MSVRRGVLLGAAVLGLAAPAWAATFTVNSTADAVDVAPGDGVCAAADGSCTLRAAVMEANASRGQDDVIVLPAGHYTLTLAGPRSLGAATGDLDIEDNLTINGEGAAVTIIDGGGIDRVFDNFVTLRLNDLTITGGRFLEGSDGGGGIANSDFLYLTHVVVRGNTATLGGGGILNYSDLFIADSTIEDNTVVASGGPYRDLGGGGIGNEANLHLDRTTVRGNSAPFGGGLVNDAFAFVTDSTFSGNTATTDGGGVWSDSDLTVVSSTISGNSASAGAAIFDLRTKDRLAGVTIDGELAMEGGTIDLANTILAGNCVFTGGGTLVSHGHNLARDTSCGLSGPGDLQGVDPRLGPLQDNGGPTQTEALSPGSPAIDAGGDDPLSLPGFSGTFIGACPATDQRGTTRPQRAHCDIGAYEALPMRTPTPCDQDKVLPENGVLLGHTWEAPYKVSTDEGLVLNDVKLGPRYMAQQISVPYFRLTTGALATTRGELTPDGNQSVARSRLIDFSKHEPLDPEDADPAWVEAVYAIDRIPEGSNSCLVVTQRYEFEQEKPHGGCEPFGPNPALLQRELVNCSVWRPLVKYEFFGDGDTLVSLNVPQRLHFRDNNEPLQLAAVFRDPDDPLQLLRPPHVRPLGFLPRMDIRKETVRPLLAISKGRAGEWDNYHQSFQEITEPFPLTGPGCAECVHIHWRWGKLVQDFPGKHDATPIIPDGSNQTVELGIVAFHPGKSEEHPNDFLALSNPRESLDGQEPVLWYSGTAYQASDTFFFHGAFFQPKPEADLVLSAVAPASVTPGEDVAIIFRVDNDGPSFATDVRLEAQRSHPAAALFLPIDSSPGCGVADLRAPVVCRLGDIAPHTSRTVRVVFGQMPRSRRRLVTRARVVESRRDPNPSNDHVVVQTIVTP